MFGIVVVIQNVLRLETHQNDVFLKKKIIFKISTSKRSENIKNLILNKKN
jgi:hypothetical protein